MRPVPETVDLKLRDAEGLVKEPPAGLLKEHGIDATRQVAWRCVPMEEVNVKGSDVASRSGFAPVGLAATPEGVVWRMPAEPPIYQSVEETDPAAGLCHPRHPCKEPGRMRESFRRVLQDMAKKILKDPAGVPYWVVTSRGGRKTRDEMRTIYIYDIYIYMISYVTYVPGKPDEQMDTGPLSQDKGVPRHGLQAPCRQGNDEPAKLERKRSPSWRSSRRALPRCGSSEERGKRSSCGLLPCMYGGAQFL